MLIVTEQCGAVTVMKLRNIGLSGSTSTLYLRGKHAHLVQSATATIVCCTVYNYCAVNKINTYICLCAPGTTVSVHVPFCWVHRHGNHLQHDSSRGHSASAHAYTEVLLLGSQPSRRQRYHAKGPWWAHLQYICFFSQHKSTYLSFLLCSMIWFKLVFC